MAMAADAATLRVVAEREGENAVGLTSDEAARRLDDVGPNEIHGAARSGMLAEIARRLASPLVVILAMASAVSAALGDVANALVVTSIVVLSVVVELAQTRRSRRAADALQARVAQAATVLRDGRWCELPRRLVVPGDVVRVVAGDLIPADAVLLGAKDLHVSEAALTGESLPVEKSGDGATTIAMGSSVVSGSGVARVTLTGQRTAFGSIAQSLAARPPRSEFERGTARFGVFILKTVLFLVLFVFVVSAAEKRDPLESLLFAVALAVGLTPEFLPMITTVTLTKGALRMARANVIVKNLAAIQNFGSMDVLCSDKTGTLTTGVMKLERSVDLFGSDSGAPLAIGAVNSRFESGVGNAMDRAILEAAGADEGWEKIDEIPFDFERRCVSIVARKGARSLLAVKGAPEHVLALCAAYEKADGTTAALDDAARAAARATFEALGHEGFRALAVAYASVAPRGTYTKDDERDLVLAGLLAFADPPRSDTRAVVRALARDGVKIKVVTGDSELVAAHVCTAVGIPTHRLLTGAEIDKMSEPALAHRVEHTDLFARVTPAQKSRILAALRARGHVVGFLGDGINDAPSLHAADVGISVSSAVDVAKEAADIILLEPGLRVLHQGVIEGRRAFGNVMKYLLMGTSSNFGNMFSMAAATVLLPFLPMLPTQILLNNFLYDLAQITIPTDLVDAGFTRRPHRWDIATIRRFMLCIGPVSSVYDLLTFYVLLRVFHAPAPLFHTGWFVESLATQTLVIFVIRTFGSPLRSRASKPLVATTLAVVLLALVLPFTRAGALFGFVPLPAVFFGFLAVAVVTYLGLVEAVKRLVLKRALG